MAEVSQPAGTGNGLAEVTHFVSHLRFAGVQPGPQARRSSGLEFALDGQRTGERFGRPGKGGQQRAPVWSSEGPDAAMTADGGAENGLDVFHGLVCPGAVPLPLRWGAVQVGRDEGGRPRRQ